jgi:hypothetical protein
LSLLSLLQLLLSIAVFVIPQGSAIALLLSVLPQTHYPHRLGEGRVFAATVNSPTIIWLRQNSSTSKRNQFIDPAKERSVRRTN